MLRKITLADLTGRVVVPGDPDYNMARQGFNRAIQQFPCVIVYCCSRKDVSNAILYAKTHELAIRIRSGGHNYEGFSSGNGVLIIDLSEMKKLRIDDEAETIYVQGGVKNQELYEFVASKGYPFPGGTCPTVGVSGYVLGGGWGLSCRYLGLGCDSLLSVEIIDGDGELIIADRRHHADLFWACRGAGGGNFGVIVGMVFRLPKPVKFVTLIEIDYLHVTQGEQEVFLEKWQEWLQDADNRLTLIARLYNSREDGLAMLVRGFYYGTKADAENEIFSFLQLPNAVSQITEMTFLEAIRIIGSSYPPFEKFNAVSRFVCCDLDKEEIKKTVQLIQKPATGAVFTGISLYALGGEVRETNQDESAFYYREANYILWLETIWEENRYAQENRKWIQRRYPCLAELTTGAYVNFPYLGLDEYLEEYYGSHEEMLYAIKCCYDPEGVFSFPQGISEDDSSLQNDFITHDEEPVERLPEGTNHRGFRYIST